MGRACQEDGKKTVNKYIYGRNVIKWMLNENKNESMMNVKEGKMKEYKWQI